MKKPTSLFLIVAFLSLAAMSGCEPFSTATLPVPTLRLTHTYTPGRTPRPTPTRTPTRTLTPVPLIIVWDASDSGEGTLRQALDTANAISGDTNPIVTIKFEPDVFPLRAPGTIVVESELPHIHKSNLVLDASNAGVILDGGVLDRDSRTAGLQIVDAHGVMIQGLQISNFPGPAIAISGNSTNNVIGGDRGLGAGPYGQGNMLTENAEGIDLAKTWLNTITGNLIGTNITGTQDLGNLHSGIKIWEGAHGNTIGPYNLIAYDGECGVYIEGTNSSGNTLTRNSIHENTRAGICLWDGANANIDAPYIFSVDLTQNLVSGISCAGCTVGIFSTQDGEEGQYYQGQVVANSDGTFAFNNGIAFRFDNITSTATDADGNTSEFSRPAGLFDTYDVALQEDNPFPRFLLVPRPSNLLEPDTRIGTGLYSSNIWNDIPNLKFLINDITDSGVKRLDTSLNENEPPINWDFSEEEIPLEFDRFIDDLNNNGIAVNYLFHFWDKDGHANGEELSTPRFKTHDQIKDFLRYVSTIVSHFKGRIQYYTIWTEPDYCGDGGIKCIETADYINLAKETIPVIQHEDPQAKVALAPYVLYFARDDVFTILRSDVTSMFDVIQWHGIYDVYPNNEFYGEYYYEYPSIIEEIKQTASANGFDGEYWGTELTWCSRENPDCLVREKPWEILETGKLVAKYSARAFVMQLGMDVGVGWGGIGGNGQGWMWPTILNLNTIMAGTTPTSLAVEIDSPVKNHSYALNGTWNPPVFEGEEINKAENIASYSFTNSDGDKLFSLWTDHTAVDNDPSVNTCLIFRGLEAQKVVGLDALYGFEQELVTEKTNGNIIICNLLVKDYPIILRFIR